MFGIKGCFALKMEVKQTVERELQRRKQGEQADKKQ